MQPFSGLRCMHLRNFEMSRPLILDHVGKLPDQLSSARVWPAILCYLVNVASI